MTTEINSLLNSLRPPNQDQSVGAASRVSKPGQAEAVSPVVDPRRAEDPSTSREEKPDDSIEGAVSDLNNLAQQMRRELQFSVEEESGELVVKVIDKETDEVVRQIPSEVLLELRKRMTEAAGAIFSDSV